MSNKTRKQVKRKHTDLLKDDANLKRWYDNINNRSNCEAGVYLRTLSRFCRNFAKVTPAQFASLTTEQMENKVYDFVQHIQSTINPRTGKHYAPSFIESYVKAIMSWARWNRKKFERKIEIKDVGNFPVAENENTPSVEDLRSLLYAATTPRRTRTSICLTSFSGVRLEVDGNHVELDGRMWEEFPSLEESH